MQTSLIKHRSGFEALLADHLVQVPHEWFVLHRPCVDVWHSVRGCPDPLPLWLLLTILNLGPTASMVSLVLLRDGLQAFNPFVLHVMQLILFLLRTF